MGMIAGQNLIVLMLTAMEHDIQAKQNYYMDSQMLLSMQSIFLGTQKSKIFEKASGMSAGSDEYKKLIETEIGKIEVAEQRVQLMEKRLEMMLNQLRTQLEQVQKRKESAQKVLDNNIKGAFDYGQ